MTTDEAIALVEKHGVVLASAKGPVVNLAEIITGEPIKGSWWAHAKSKQIFRLLRAVADSEQVLVCRLINNKVTFVHRRLWPALVRIAEQLTNKQLAKISEEHTTNGRHLTHEIPFPNWVSADISAQAKQLTKAEALAMLAACNVVVP